MKLSFDEQVAAVLASLITIATVAIAVGVGYFFGAGLGWLSFGLMCLWHAKGIREAYHSLEDDELPAHSMGETPEPSEGKIVNFISDEEMDAILSMDDE